MGRRRGKYGSRPGKFKGVQYRSQFEVRVAKLLPPEVRATYESCKIKYMVPAQEHTYTPDWVLPGIWAKRCDYIKDVSYLEAGILTLAKRKKLLLLQSDGHDIKVLLCSDRAPGMKRSASSWCEKHGFDYALSVEGKVPKGWLK